MEAPSLEQVTQAMAAHHRLYAWRRPVYQWAMLSGLVRAWKTVPRSILDVGGGTGLMAQVIQDLYPGTKVTVVDVQDRVLPTLSVSSQVYDGERIPFERGSFDCAILLNVLHHVPVPERAPLLKECLRVTSGGPLYMKDHLSTGMLDDVRLWALDMLGNAPFGGMVKASYLRADEWDSLAAKTFCVTERQPARPFRRGPSAAFFPNRLEIMMTWRAAASP